MGESPAIGKTNVHQIERRIRLDGVSGTEAVQTGMRVSVPDKGGSPTPELLVRLGTEEWLNVGAIGDVE